MSTDFALYLHALGWSPARIGAVLTSVLSFSVILTALIGPLSDRFGRRGFLLGYEATVILAGLIALLSANSWCLIPAAILGGFGRGGGAASPFAPAEQAWLSNAVSSTGRGRIYSLSSALGMGGFACGALLGAVPDLLHRWLPGASAFRVIFVVVIIASAAAAVALAGAPDIRRPSPIAHDRAPARRENRLLRRLAAINLLNGLGIGLTGPLMAYWFNLRYGMGPAEIAPVMALAYATASAGSALTGRLIARVGVMGAVVWPRSAALVLLAAIPMMPSFALAAALFILRVACNMGTAGARQSLNIGLVRSGRRGAAASLSSVSVQIPRAVGPTIAGLLFSFGAIATPFFVAASLQTAYLVFYQRTFRHHDPNRRRSVKH